MPAASSRVDVTFRLKGQDQASAAIRSTAKSTDGLRLKMSSAAGAAVGLAGAITIIRTGAQVFAAAIEPVAKFSAELGKIETLMPGNSRRVHELGDAVRRLSREMGVARSDLSEGAFQVVSAFGDAPDTIKKLETVTKAAKAGGADAASSLSLLSAVTKGYGDTSAAALVHASDLAFMTNKLGQTTFPELAASIGKVVPLASQLGVSQEELFTVFATLTGVTGNAAEVSTQLSSALTAMLKPSTGASKAIKRLGNGSARAAIEQLGLVGAFKAMAAESGTSAEAMQELFKRKEAVLGVMPLLTSQSDVFTKKLGQMQQASGATEAAHRAHAQGSGKLATELAKTKSAFSDMVLELGIAVGDGGDMTKLLKGLRQVIDAVARWGRVLIQLVKVAINPFVDAVALTAEGLFAVSFAAGALATGNVKAAGEAMETFAASMKRTARLGAEDFKKLGEAIDAAMKGDTRPGEIDMSKGGFVSVDELIRRGHAKEQRELNRRLAARAGRRGKKGKGDDDGMAEFLKDDPLGDAQAFASLTKLQDDVEEKSRMKKLAGELMINKFMADMHKEEMDRINERRIGQLDLFAAIADGSVALAQSLGASEKMLAPIKLAMVLGEAALAFLRATNPAEKAAAIAAGAVGVAQFGSIMAGGGGASGLQGLATGGGPSAASGLGGGAGGGSTTVIVQFSDGVVLGTPHTVGKAVKQAIGATAGTGF